MTVSDLIKILQSYDENMQVVCPDGAYYSYLSESEVQIKDLYPDLTDQDNSSGNSGQTETYLMITTNQFN